MRLVWVALCALVLSAIAGMPGVGVPVGGAVDRLESPSDDAADDQLVAVDADDDDDDDDLDDATLFAVAYGQAGAPAPMVLVASPLIAPLSRIAIDDLFRPPRFSSV